MKGMVLAAGKGTRLFPLTGVIPKPLAPVAGKPIIQHIFELLTKAGVDEIHVNVHYLADAILSSYGGEEVQVNSARTYFTREERLMGSAGGAKRIAEIARFDETFVVIMGDALTDVDLRELVSFHRERGALATLALKRVADTTGYGVAELDAEENILRFQEKPQTREAVSNLANTGIYVLEPEALDYVPDDTFFDFADEVFPRLLEAGEKVVGYDVDGSYWSDVGTLESYKEAQRDALSGRVAVEVPGERCGGGLWISEEARIHPSAYRLMEGYAFVGREAVVGLGASLSGVAAVGDDCRVGDGATVKRRFLLPGASVGRGAYLEDCIVGPGYEIRPGERIRGGALVRGAPSEASS